MSRRTLLVRLVAGVVGIVAIALAAATIENPIETGGSGGTGGDGTGPPQNPPAEDPGAAATDLPAFLEYLLLAIAVALAVALAWYLINHRREAVKLIAIGLVIVLLMVGLGFALSAVDFDGPTDREPPPEPPNESGGDPGLGEGDGEGVSVPSSFRTLLLALVAVVTIFAGALVLNGDRSSAPAGVVEDEQTDDDAAAVGAAAGRAAERIESGGDDDVDNEVYRAWRDMTQLLEVDRPETSTPGEFATAAIEAGLAREHVDELTRLFEDVRYGHAETTDELEARAVSTLRRIEEEYADAGDDVDEPETGGPVGDSSAGGGRR